MAAWGYTLTRVRGSDIMVMKKMYSEYEISPSPFKSTCDQIPCARAHMLRYTCLRLHGAIEDTYTVHSPDPYACLHACTRVFVGVHVINRRAGARIHLPAEIGAWQPAGDV